MTHPLVFEHLVGVITQLQIDHAYRPRGNTKDAPGLEAACACGQWSSPVATFNGAMNLHRKHVAEVMLQLGLLVDVSCPSCAGAGTRTYGRSVAYPPVVCTSCNGWGARLEWIPRSTIEEKED